MADWNRERAQGYVEGVEATLTEVLDHLRGQGIVIDQVSLAGIRAQLFHDVCRDPSATFSPAARTELARLNG